MVYRQGQHFEALQIPENGHIRQIIAPKVELLDEVKRLPGLHYYELLRQCDSLLDFGGAAPVLTLLCRMLHATRLVSFKIYIIVKLVGETNLQFELIL